MKYKRILQIVKAVLSVAIIFRWGYNIIFHCRFLPDKLTCFGIAMLLVTMNIQRLKPSDSHGVCSLLLQYIMNKALYMMGSLLIRKLKKLGTNLKEQQELLLLDIIKVNRDTKVARHFSLHLVSTMEQYKNKVPLTSYSDYDNFVSDVYQHGAPDVFFPAQTTYVAMTSGTTSGKSKWIPKSLKVVRKTMGRWIISSFKCFLDIKNNYLLRKWLCVRPFVKTTYCPSGIRAGPISGLASRFSMTPYVVPSTVNDIRDDQDVVYLNIVFGIKHHDICNLFFSTAHMANLFFQVLEKRWSEACNDIERGTISDNLNICMDQRRVLCQSLGGPDPGRANRLRIEFKEGMSDIVPRIWPECAGLFCLATGAFQTQADTLRKCYLGHVPLFSSYHSSSETLYGINYNLEDQDISYTAMIPYNVFEFIPVDLVNEIKPSTCLCNQVEVGKQYELVVTTYEGLYRYRSGDIVEISGFNWSIPKYRFVRRTMDVLCAYHEQVPEIVLSTVIREWASKNKLSLVEFISVESFYIDQSDQPHYVVLVEVQGSSDLPVDVTDNAVELVDTALRRLHEVYSAYRTGNKLGPVEIIQLCPGTFAQLATHMMMENTHMVATQYKLPRIIRRLHLLKFLLKRRKIQH